MRHSHFPFFFFLHSSGVHPDLLSFPTRRSSDLEPTRLSRDLKHFECSLLRPLEYISIFNCPAPPCNPFRSEEHTSELQSRFDLVCRLLLEKKNKTTYTKSHCRVGRSNHQYTLPH